jgi:hypothetical protein
VISEALIPCKVFNAQCLLNALPYLSQVKVFTYIYINEAVIVTIDYRDTLKVNQLLCKLDVYLELVGTI